VPRYTIINYLSYEMFRFESWDKNLLREAA